MLAASFAAWNFGRSVVERLRGRESARGRARAPQKEDRERGARDSCRIEVGLVARQGLTYKLPDGYLKRTSVHYTDVISLLAPDYAS